MHPRKSDIVTTRQKVGPRQANDPLNGVSRGADVESVAYQNLPANFFIFFHFFPGFFSQIFLPGRELVPILGDKHGSKRLYYGIPDLCLSSKAPH